MTIRILFQSVKVICFSVIYFTSVSLVLSLVRIGYGSATFVLRWRRFTLKYRHMATMQIVESR